MQIIAKAVLSGLGLLLAVRLCSSAVPILAQTGVPAGARALTLTAAAVCITAILVWGVCNNTRTARWVVGDGEVPAEHKQHSAMIVSYRLALLLAGLFLLPGAFETVGRLLVFLWPPHLREAFTWLINTGTFPGRDARAWQWYAWILDGFKAALAFYLILGAPHFVRWQVNRSVPDVDEGPSFSEAVQ